MLWRLVVAMGQRTPTVCPDPAGKGKRHTDKKSYFFIFTIHLMTQWLIISPGMKLA
jgi:hypothetical protein